jgi:putative copper export protein/methionine-rich copper-binding protein CopC
VIARRLAFGAVTRRLACAAGLACAALLSVPGAASAHADLVAASPADRTVLAQEPRQVTLVFSEPVTLALSHVTVIAPNGHRVDRGAPAAAGPGGDRIRVGLAPETAHGTYVVAWRTTAADDGHTTSGQLTFVVGAPGGSGPAAAGPGLRGGPDRLTDAVQDAGVWLGFAGLAGVVGFAAIRLYCLPEPDTLVPGPRAVYGDAEVDDGDHGNGHDGNDGDHEDEAGAATGPRAAWEDPEDPQDPHDTQGPDHVTGPEPHHDADGPGHPDDPEAAEAAEGTVPAEGGAGAVPSWAAVRWPAGAGWALLLAGTLIQLLVYGPAAQGGSPGSAFDRSLLSDSLSSHVGHALVARFMLLALIAAVGEEVLRHRRAGRVAAAVLALALALTWSETSHAPAGPLVPLAVTVTTLHVAAMAVWAGGMACLVVLLARGGDAGQAEHLGAAARRFSRLALGAVSVLAATGLYQGYREVGGFHALAATHYGRLLLTKAALFLLVVAVAARTHSGVRRRDRPASPREARRPILLELAGVTGVLVVTVLLLSTAPAHVPHTQAPPAVRGGTAEGTPGGAGG